MKENDGAKIRSDKCDDVTLRERSLIIHWQIKLKFIQLSVNHYSLLYQDYVSVLYRERQLRDEKIISSYNYK